MTKEDFIERFDAILRKIDCNKDFAKFYLHPIEENKSYNSVDDYFRLSIKYNGALKNGNCYCFDQVIKILTWYKDRYPMWIDIFVDKSSGVHLYFSMRFRKQSEVLMSPNRDLNPFKIITDNKQYDL